MRKLMMASASLAALSLASAPRAVHAAPRADATDPNVLIAQLATAFEEFKATQAQARTDGDTLVQQKIAALNDEMSNLTDALDEANRRIAAGQIGGLGAPVDPEHDEQIRAYMRSGALPTVQAAMSEGTDSAGGYLVPVEWDRTIVDKLKQRSPIRDNASVVTIGGRGFTKIYNDGVIGSGWVGETAARPETTTPGLTSLQFDVGELYANPAVTQRMLDDAGFDLEAWLTGEVDGEFATQENIAFVSGNGTNKPFGILTYVTGAANAAKNPLGAITVTNAADDVNIAFNDLNTLIYSLPSEREGNAKWYLNRTTLGAIRGLVDSNGQPLWQPSYIAGQPATLMGYPVVEVPGMPTPAASAVVALFGDMEQTYLVIDRKGTTVLRDPFTNKPYVHFYTTKRVGGGVQQPEYMKALKMAAG